MPFPMGMDLHGDGPPWQQSSMGMDLYGSSPPWGWTAMGSAHASDLVLAMRKAPGALHINGQPGRAAPAKSSLLPVFAPQQAV